MSLLISDSLWARMDQNGSTRLRTGCPSVLTRLRIDRAASCGHVTDIQLAVNYGKRCHRSSIWSGAVLKPSLCSLLAEGSTNIRGPLPASRSSDCLAGNGRTNLPHQVSEWLFPCTCTFSMALDILAHIKSSRLDRVFENTSFEW